MIIEVFLTSNPFRNRQGARAVQLYFGISSSENDTDGNFVVYRAHLWYPFGSGNASLIKVTRNDPYHTVPLSRNVPEVTMLFSLTRWMETLLYSSLLCNIPVLHINLISIFG